MPSKLRDSWEDMLRRLKAFRKRAGHCDVPTNFEKDPPLGRWLAMQRHKHKIGELSVERVKAFERLGVTWSPSDVAWHGMFRALAEFKRQHGHCNVPTKWKENVKLAVWVQRQRIWYKKKKKLKPNRVEHLEAIGFSWAIYKGCEQKQSSARRQPPAAAAPAAEKEPIACERLYRLGNGTFVQAAGNGPIPAALQRFAERNRGEFPPYIPLPTRSVRFSLGEVWERQIRIAWKGKGKLPPRVLEYVQEQGTLPPYE